MHTDLQIERGLKLIGLALVCVGIFDGVAIGIGLQERTASSSCGDPSVDPSPTTWLVVSGFTNLVISCLIAFFYSVTLCKARIDTQRFRIVMLFLLFVLFLFYLCWFIAGVSYFFKFHFNCIGTKVGNAYVATMTYQCVYLIAMACVAKQSELTEGQQQQ